MVSVLSVRSHLKSLESSRKGVDPVELDFVSLWETVLVVMCVVVSVTSNDSSIHLKSQFSCGLDSRVMKVKLCVKLSFGQLDSPIQSHDTVGIRSKSNLKPRVRRRRGLEFS